jgi:hypothetical protein
VHRGGSWRSASHELRSACRHRRKPRWGGGAFGLRLVADYDKLGPAAAEGEARGPVGITPERVRALFKGKVVSFDPKTLQIELFYDFEDVAQVKDWCRSKWYLDKGGTLLVSGGKLVLARTWMQALTRAKFTSAAAKVNFTVAGGTRGVTLVVCADGEGSHYELCGLWREEGSTRWNCQLLKYVKGKAPLGELGKAWPVRRSPYAKSGRGTLLLSFEDGRVTGKVGEVLLAARDNELRAGSVGVWAYDAGRATFDNFRVAGRLDRAWLQAALNEAGPAGE